MSSRYRVLLADQGLYAASNLAAVVLAGRGATQADFGRFMLVFLGLSVVVNASRALWSEPEMAAGWTGRYPGRPGVLVCVTAAGGLLALGDPLTASCGAAVAVVVQDRLRYQALLRAQPGAALRSDAIWALLVVTAVGAQVAGLGLRLDPPAVLRLWALGAVVASLANLPPGRPTSSAPTPSVPPRSLFLGDFVLQSGATQLVGLALGAVLARPAYGELRAAITLLGPVGVANTALATLILSGRPVAGRLVAVIVGVAVAVIAVLVALPPRLGAAALGAAWPGRRVLLLIGLTVAAQTLSTLWLTGLKVASRRRLLIGLRAGGVAALALVAIGAARWSGRADVVATGYLVVNLALAAVAGWGARRVAVKPVKAGGVPDPVLSGR